MKPTRPLVNERPLEVAFEGVRARVFENVRELREVIWRRHDHLVRRKSFRNEGVEQLREGYLRNQLVHLGERLGIVVVLGFSEQGSEVVEGWKLLTVTSFA